MGFKYVQSSELHQGERLGPRRPANPPHVVNTQVLEEQTWRNRDEPRGISHTAEWTGLNGLSELTPQGRGRRQRGLGFFFPWMVNTGILGTQEKELGGGHRRGTWLHKVGLELVGEKAAGFPPLGEVGEGVPLWGSRSGGQACAGCLQRSAQETWSGLTFRGTLATKLPNTSNQRSRRLKGREVAIVAAWRGLGMMKIVRWEHQGARRNRSSTGCGGFLTRVTTFMIMIFKCFYGEI